MTDFEYRIFKFIYECKKPVRWIDVLNEFLPFGNSLQANDVLLYLLKTGKIQKTSPNAKLSKCKIVLSDFAVADLIQENERRESFACQEQRRQQEATEEAARAAEYREAERKAEHTFQAKLALWNTLLSVLLGAIASNLDRLIPFVIQIFHR